MGAIEHLTISLPADMVARLRKRVAAGDYGDESEAIEDAIARAEEIGFDEEEDELSADELAWLKREVAESIAEIDRDPSSLLTIDEVRARLAADRAEIAKMGDVQFTM